jgi:hypothetical protein
VEEVTLLIPIKTLSKKRKNDIVQLERERGDREREKERERDRQTERERDVCHSVLIDP